MPESAPKTVLIVDDEPLFLRTVADGFATMSDRVTALTAANGRVAMGILAARPLDLVVTDIKMPEVDGFELIAHMSRTCPHVPIIVMTAFGTPDIERALAQHGVLQCLDKPLDFPALATRVLEALDASASGHLMGIALPTLLQMIELDRKTCTLQVRSKGQVGLLHFNRGQLVDAEAGALEGDAAALVLVCWDRPEIEIVGGRVTRRKRISMSLAELLLEAFRQSDESARSADGIEMAASNAADVRRVRAPLEVNLNEEGSMAAMDKLKELTGIEGFAGAAVYTPTGESLAILPGDIQHLKEVGVLANNVLLNAQKASIEMGTGRGQQVHVEAEKAHIFARCLNEGTDPTKSQPGKAHIHLVLVLKSDASIGLAKMRVNAVIERLADDFRI